MLEFTSAEWWILAPDIGSHQLQLTDGLKTELKLLTGQAQASLLFLLK